MDNLPQELSATLEALESTTGEPVAIQLAALDVVCATLEAALHSVER